MFKMCRAYVPNWTMQRLDEIEERFRQQMDKRNPDGTRSVLAVTNYEIVDGEKIIQNIQKYNSDVCFFRPIWIILADSI